MAEGGEIKCRVSLLDESEIEVGITSHTNGKTLFENVCKYLNIVETDYFGLIYNGVLHQNVWVRLDKELKQQIPAHSKPWKFSFAVKFYPTDPSYLREELTKYQLCLQIRDDLTNGRLPCPLDTLALMSSYWLQSEFGDGEEESVEVKRYLLSLRYLYDEQHPMPEFEEKVQHLYKSRHGMPPCDADTQFLRLASTLPMYGVHRYVTEDPKHDEIKLGIGSAGIVVIEAKQDPIYYKWRNIKNINYKKHKFYVKLLPTAKGKSEKKSFPFQTTAQAKAVWRNAVDQHVFFRVSESDTTSRSSSVANSPAVSRGKPSKKGKSSFRLSFRKKQPKTEVEAREASAKIKRPNPAVIRHSSLRRSTSQSSADETESVNKQATAKEPLKISKNDENSKIQEVEDNKQPEPDKQPPLRSILKTPKPLSEPNEFDEGERPFMDEDFIIERNRETMQSSLLLTVTIPEEDEDLEDQEKETQVKLPLSSEDVKDTTISSTLPDKTSDKIENESINVATLINTEQPKKISETEDLQTNIPYPVVIVETCPSVESPPTSPIIKTKLIPPMVSQNTREAFIPKVDEPNKNIAEENKAVDSADQQNENVNSINNVKTDIESKSLLPSLVSHGFDNQTSPYMTGEYEKEASNEDEEDRKTLGAGSAVAVMGDDDITVGDLIDDVTIGELSEGARGKSDSDHTSFADKGSEITNSSRSSLSDITDNTEELCNPNILDIIWAKCPAFKESVEPYHVMFGVKLRHIRGREKHIRSGVYDFHHHSIGTQVPSPPPTQEEMKNGARRHISGVDKQISNKFIPSWPFDPQSLALNIDLDDLDKEAVKAALLAQQDLKSSITHTIDETKFTDDLLYENSSSSFQWNSKNVTTTIIETNKTTSSVLTDSIPGIPSFMKSVDLTDEAHLPPPPILQTSSLSRKHFSETLVYPPSIKKFDPIKEELLVYKPKDNKASTPRHDPTTFKNQSALLQETDNKTSTTLLGRTDTVSARDALNVTKHSQDLVDQELTPSTLHQNPVSEKKTAIRLSDYSEISEHDESGRSTPSSLSSGSSFPRFVHSVFPLRKQSSSSLSPKRDSKCSSGDENDKANSSTLSECSNRSTKGSSSAESSVGDEESSEINNFSSNSQERITIIAFINEESESSRALEEGVGIEVNDITATYSCDSFESESVSNNTEETMSYHKDTETESNAHVDVVICSFAADNDNMPIEISSSSDCSSIVEELTNHENTTKEEFGEMEEKFDSTIKSDHEEYSPEPKNSQKPHEDDRDVISHSPPTKLNDDDDVFNDESLLDQDATNKESSEYTPSESSDSEIADIYQTAVASEGNIQEPDISVDNCEDSGSDTK